MAVKKVAVPELGTIHLHKRRGARGMRLSITNQGTIRVSLPHWLPFSTGLEFAKQKQDWIRSQRIVPSALRHGAHVGKAHRLAFLAVDSRTATVARTTGGEIRIYHPSHLSTEDSSIQSIAEKACIRALKSQAEALLPRRLADLATRHGFSYQNVRIKQLKSRWGSCNEEKDIALSCYLMQLPWHLIDYVLLHELVHTRVMAHGPPFWKELENYVPNLKTFRKEIKTHRPMLTTE